MNPDNQPVSKSARLSRTWKLRALFAFSLLWVGPTLACGSFAPRPTPTPTLPTVVETSVDTPGEATPAFDLNATPAPLVESDTPTPEADGNLHADANSGHRAGGWSAGPHRRTGRSQHAWRCQPGRRTSSLPSSQSQSQRGRRADRF